MKIINQGEGYFEILDGFGHDGSLIRKAATTCYRSEETSKRTADEFITMLKSNTHLAMLEFSWFVVKITMNKKYEIFEKHAFQSIYLAIQTTKYLKCNYFDTNSIVISGNGRAWLDFFESEEAGLYAENIKDKLNTLNPVLFDFKEIIINDYVDVEILNKAPNRWHNWIAVKFFNVSRGFTHELVRHRVMSFAQASTRYIDNSNFNVVLSAKTLYPDLAFELLEHLDKTEQLYSKLVENGYKKEDARQILPIGIANEICVAGRLNDWLGVFKLRCDKAAHWEIREIMVKLQKEFKERGWK